VSNIDPAIKIALKPRPAKKYPSLVLTSPRVLLYDTHATIDIKKIQLRIVRRISLFVTRNTALALEFKKEAV
jgi:hypothetical protein